MQIAKDTVVTFHYRLSEGAAAFTEQGAEQSPELESSAETMPLSYLHGHGNIMRGLEEAMEGLSAGDTKQVTLPPEKAYGQRRAGAEQRVPVKHLAGKYKRLRPGMLVKVNTEKGLRDAQVIKAGKFTVDLDMNHPFAGKTLVFDVRIVSVRDASEEEIAHGHVHGEGGHHH